MSAFCAQAPTRETQTVELALASGHPEILEGTTLKENLLEAWLPLERVGPGCVPMEVEARA